jgi:hypothetical protein
VYEINFDENVPAGIQQNITETCGVLNQVAAEAAAGLGRTLQTTWFGNAATSADVLGKLKRYDNYLNKRCVRLTFAWKTVGQVVDCADVENGDIAQVQRGVREPTGEKFITSGLRIYLLPVFSQRDRTERVNTLAHEVSHKILDTTDRPSGVNVYGRNLARALAVSNGAAAAKCAENWGIFYEDLMKARSH